MFEFHSIIYLSCSPSFVHEPHASTSSFTMPFCLQRSFPQLLPLLFDDPTVLARTLKLFNVSKASSHLHQAISLYRTIHSSTFNFLFTFRTFCVVIQATTDVNQNFGHWPFKFHFLGDKLANPYMIHTFAIHSTFKLSLFHTLIC